MLSPFFAILVHWNNWTFAMLCMCPYSVALSSVVFRHCKETIYASCLIIMPPGDEKARQFCAS